MEKRQYDVALSFAGEDRRHAERLAELLRADGYSVFYDENERAQLWSANLYDRLRSIYKDQAHYCVMFLSKHYAQKPWTNHERQSAQARAFDGDPEYILRVRIDDTEIEGILPTDAYLDLRTRDIEEIYQVLVEKLSGTTSQTVTTDIPTSASVEDDPGEFALLYSRNRKLYFIPVQNSYRNAREISLELLAELPEQISFLSSLINDFRAVFPVRNIFAFALGEHAAWVSPKDVAQIMSGPQTSWTVVLTEDVCLGQDINLSRDATFGKITPDQIAEMRARRILLNEKLEPPRPSFSQVDELNQRELESLIRGSASSDEIILEVPESPIPSLYQSYGQTPERFQKFARLAAVLYLKLSDTIGDVLQLDLKLLDSKQLQVRFKGRRPRATTTTGPAIIEVDEICPL